jgi:hypothetical protein
VDVVSGKEKRSQEVPPFLVGAAASGVADLFPGGSLVVQVFRAFLGKESDLHVQAELDDARRRILVSAQDSCEGGFAGAVDADQGDPIASGDGETEVPENLQRAVGF